MQSIIVFILEAQQPLSASSDWLCGPPPKWPILCRVGR